VPQKITPQAEELYEEFEIVVWWATPVELASALARLLRTRQLGSREFSESHRIAREISQWWLPMQPSDSLRARATSLVERHDLSAADALQLAAALEWCGGNSSDRVFLSFDRRLREAATLSGFDTTQL
jgi:predicted nucleic acid-binding protein